MVILLPYHRFRNAAPEKFSPGGCGRLWRKNQPRGVPCAFGFGKFFSWLRPVAPAWILLESAEAFPNDAPTVSPITTPIATFNAAMTDFLTYVGEAILFLPFVIYITAPLWVPILLGALELFCDACELYACIEDWYERRSAAKN